jgi:hypothetical protein
MTRNKKFQILNLILWLPMSAMALSTATTPTTSGNFTFLNIDTDKNDVSTYFKSSYLSQESDLNKANIFRFQMGLTLDKQVLEQVKFKLNTSISLYTGNSDSLYDNNEFKSQSNSISLKRAEFVWSPLSGVKLKAGALAMRDTRHELLVGRGTFLGTKESFTYKSGGFKANLSAVQSIPKNANYSNRLDEVNEENPSFYLESIDLKYGNKQTFIRSTTSHYAYSNLSNSVAATSHYLGNSVNLMDRSNGDFLYSYIGYAQRLEGKVTVNSFSFSPYGEYVVNTAAPSNNEGKLVGIETIYTLNDKAYGVDLSTFNTDADSSVAFYNSSLYRGNNKLGNVIRLEYRDLKSDSKIEMILIDSRNKIDNELDSNNGEEQIISLTLRKEYDLF